MIVFHRSVAFFGAILLLQLVTRVSSLVVEEPISSPVEETPSSPSATRGAGGSVAAGYVPYSSTDGLGRAISPYYCDLTRLNVNKTEFDRRCGSSPDAKGPCFSVHGDTTMAMASVQPWSAPLRIEDHILIEDDRAVTFTTKDPTDEFVVSFEDFWGATLRYYAYENNTGCYKIHLTGTFHNRIYVKDQDGDDRDIDTLNYGRTGKRLCSKWIDMTIKTRDSALPFEVHDDDGRGI